MEYFQARQSYSQTLSIEEVARRLACQPQVDGVVLMGSGARAALSPSSDIDLLVLLAPEAPQQFMLSTTIQERLAEVYFASSAELVAFLARSQNAQATSYQTTLMGWIARGQILFDRAGRVGELRAKLAQSDWASVPADGELYDAWYATNYDLVQTQRLLGTQDPIVQMKADLRLLFMVDQLWSRYFLVRRLVGMSHKASIVWMADNDPEFFARMQALLLEPQRERKFEQYCLLAARALKPVGGLWPQEMTAVQLIDHADPGLAASQLDLWQRWMA
jgi:predicted nucleotidyltransferase